MNHNVHKMYEKLQISNISDKKKSHISDTSDKKNHIYQIQVTKKSHMYNTNDKKITHVKYKCQSEKSNFSNNKNTKTL